ncbi:MAG: ABC transporter permease [Actinobacteria bacterium]|nr:ABC transporter permease [Actinomycetota bacterium]
MILAQGEPLLEWDWIVRHSSQIFERFLQHAELTAIAVGIGLLISFPVAVFAYRHRWLIGPVTWFTGLLYTIPSLALFAFLVPYTGLSTTTAEIGLVSYTLLILIRNIVAGLDGVPADTREAAIGMGYTKRQLLWKVELPLALPVMVAGIRIASVTTIGLVTVTALIGQGGLGYFILLGLRRFFSTPIIAGTILSVAFAMTVDAALLIGQRALTPWVRRKSPGLAS